MGTNSIGAGLFATLQLVSCQFDQGIGAALPRLAGVARCGRPVQSADRGVEEFAAFGIKVAVEHKDAVISSAEM